MGTVHNSNLSAIAAAEPPASRTASGQLRTERKEELWRRLSGLQKQLQSYHLLEKTLTNTKHRKETNFGKGRLLITAFYHRLTHAVTK